MPVYEKMKNHSISMFLMLVVAVLILRNFSSLVLIVLACVACYRILVNKIDRGLDVIERKIIYILFALFVTGLFSYFSAIYNTEIEYIGINLQYLLAIPVLFYFRQKEIDITELKKGFIIAAVVYGVYAIYEFLVNGGVRVRSPFGPVGFGFISMLVSSVIMDLMVRKRLELKKGLLPFVLALIALILSGTRNAWIAFVIVALVMLVLHGREFQKKAFSLIVVMALIVTVFAVFPNSTVQKRLFLIKDDVSRYIGSDLDSRDRVTSIGLRFEGWQAAIQLFKERPLIGVGLGAFKGGVVSLAEDGKRNTLTTLISHAHNDYLQVMAERGLLGIALFLLMHATFVVFYYKHKNDENQTMTDMANIGLVITIGFIVLGFADAPFTGNVYQSMYLLINLLLVTQMTKLKKLTKV